MTPADPFSQHEPPALGGRTGAGLRRVRRGRAEVARAAHAFAEASDALGKRIQAAGGWDGSQIAAEYDAWKRAEQELISAARMHFGAS